MQKKILTSFLLLLIASFSYGLGTVVIGKVYDKKTHEPIFAANVWFTGTSIGVITNEEGGFILRSSNQEKELKVSMIGYKTQTIQIKDISDMISINLEEDFAVMDDIVVHPTENPAFAVIRNIHKHRKENDDSYRKDYQMLSHNNTQLVLNDIPEKSKSQSLASDLVNHAIRLPSGERVLPVYMRNRIERLYNTPDSNYSKVLDQQKNTFHILPEKSWDEFISYYQPKIDFYNDNVYVLDNNFLSPLASAAKSMYHLYLDSTRVDSIKTYKISFSPKVKSILLFEGEMIIDSASWALTKIRASVPKGLNINYLRKCDIYQSFKPVNGQYWLHESKYSMGIAIDIIPPEINPYYKATLTQSHTYSRQLYNKDTIQSQVPLEFDEQFAKLPELNKKTVADWQSLDKLNNTPTQKFLYTVVDLGINGYISKGMIDWGPVTNMVRYNPFEGQAQRLSLRTSEKFSKNFSMGGYVGYGMRDQKMKYGVNFNYRFGLTPRHTFGVSFDNKAIPYGYDNFHYERENRVDEVYNMLTLAWNNNRMPRMAQTQKINTKYSYEIPASDGFGIKVEWQNGVSRSHTNNVVPLYQGKNTMIDHVDLAYSRLMCRFSWQQRSFDNYFHRVYLKTPYPVIHTIFEGGYYEAGKQAKPYAKFTLLFRQTYPSYYGKMYANISGVYVVGKVPFQLLHIAKGERGASYDRSGFSTLNQMELVADRFIGGHFRFQTKGYLFNKIPYVSKFNWREDVLFGAAYGTLKQSHQNITHLDLYDYDHSVPFVEAGFGVSNIMRVLALQSVWRVTHRDDPNAMLWGIKFLLAIDF